jgi:hypothetical protein
MRNASTNPFLSQLKGLPCQASIIAPDAADGKGASDFNSPIL